MYSSLITRAALAALIIAGAASAQNLSAAIVGCSEVGCPVKEGNAANECTLVDETFNEVGLARIPTDVSDLAGISWVQGNSVTDVGHRDDDFPTERSLRRNFYLGTPAGFGLGSTRACAAFFHKSTAQFPGGATETAGGTCEQAMAPDCVEALLARARSLSFADGDDVCEKLEDDLKENLDRDCRDVAGFTYWRDLSVKTILGDDAPAVILSSDNITSNCWPITPKQDDLAFIESQTDIEFFYGVTPILTVFYNTGSDTPLTRNAAQMTCLKTMGPSPASNKTEEDDDDDDDGNDDAQNSTTFMRSSSATVLFVAAFTVLGSMML